MPDSRPSADIRADAYDGVGADRLAERLGLPRVVCFREVGSTMDAAHAAAADGAPAGTLVLAEAQTAGRGRHRRHWRSAAGRGVWLTLIERPDDASGVGVLSLRVGMAIAEAIEPLAPQPVRLKWPNDVYVPSGKLAGILIEARWRDTRVDWLAVGVGLNVSADPRDEVGTLQPEVTRVTVLERIVPAIREVARLPGPLTAAELARFASRDLAQGRTAVSPAPGTVQGIDPSGALVIAGAAGVEAHRAGSLVFAEDA